MERIAKGMSLRIPLKDVPEDKEWEEWHKLGEDNNSVIADPLFVDADKAEGIDLDAILKWETSPTGFNGLVKTGCSYAATNHRRESGQIWIGAFS